MFTTLKDMCKIKTVCEFSDSQKEDILKLADSKEENGGKRGLIITFPLSASFRRINNRIYTRRGQEGNIDSWISPYPKPILVYHDEKQDAIGRFIGVEYEPNDAEAMKFFKDTRDYARFKRAMDSDNPRTIYKELHKRNLLMNDKWPGLGRLVAKARINDADAIEKFLDGRYLTFSAGSRTDRYVCGICNSDWSQGDICEHRPGSITDEGQPAVFITGAYKGVEGSVVNNPAHNQSIVESMEFADSVEKKFEDKSFKHIYDEDYYLTDAIVDMGDSMKLKPEVEKAIAGLKDMDPRDIARSIVENTLSDFQIEAMKDRSHYATQWHIRVHDALHSEYDWKLRWSDETEEMPDAVFALHADIHDMSTSEGFRDSLVNGKLDSYGRDGVSSDEYVSSRVKKSKDDDTTPVNQDKKETDVKEALIELLSDAEFVSAFRTALADESKPSAVEPEKELEPIDLSDCDLWSLGMAVRLQLGLNAPKPEEIEALDDSSFLGEGRDFIIATKDHVEAARVVVEKARLSDDQRARLSDSLDRRISVLEVSNTQEKEVKNTDELQNKYNDLQVDYKASLTLASKLQTELDELQAKFESLDNKKVNHKDKEQEVPNIDNVKPVDSPSASSSDAINGSTSKLSGYDRKVVAKYKDISDSQGQEAAEHFLNRKKLSGHISRSFDITQYIQENN